MSKKYTIGLDIGTNSVGWAVIDDQFNLVQGKKRIDDNGIKKRVRTNLWGVRLFDEGSTAEDTRIKRGLRRRYKRRHERLNYLRGIFASEMSKVDDTFFIRLDESFYKTADKTAVEYKYRDENGVLKTARVENKEIYKYPLFKTKKDEKEFYKKFPTIYYLRNYLMNTDEKADLRWIYLGLHHIIKYRGHFVNQGQEFDLENIDIVKSLNETFDAYNKASNFFVDFDSIDPEQGNSILKNRNISKSKKVFELNQLYKIDAEMVYHGENIAHVDIFENLTDKMKVKFIEEKQKSIKELFNAIVGNKINIDKIFGKKEYSKKENEAFPDKIYYKNENFDEQIGELESLITPEELDVILIGKKVYESIVLSGILTSETLAASMIDKFELHRKQLSDLKKLTLHISDDLYIEIFKENGVYTRYIEGNGNPAKVTTQEEFYKEIKKKLEASIDGLKFPDEDKEFNWDNVKLKDEYKDIVESIGRDIYHEVYLPKQRMFNNGAIPYQVHEYELVKILENQGKYYPFLLEKSGDEYKIQKLMKFRIPYYVGPLVKANIGEPGKKESDKSRFAWMQKNSDTKITPWNFDKVVDKDASSIEFIERMTGYCTYLPEEKVLPKNSLLYQEFCVYNELIVSGYYLKGDRKRIYFGKNTINQLVELLFKRKKKVTQDDVINFLKLENNIEASELFGIDKKTVNGNPSFNSSLSTYIDLVNIGIDKKVIDDNRDIFDEIVKWQTIFTDKKSLLNRIKKANQEWNLLTDSQMEKLANKHYKGFGNLSKKLLDGIEDKNSGLTIIETLKEGGYDNFMRLVSGATADRYTFKNQIEKAQTSAQTDELTYDIVEQLAGSPALKKGIWQSLKIVKELEEFLGRENISNIVIEMSRSNEGGRIPTRYNQLKKLYENFEERNIQVFNELKGFENDKESLNSEKLHLYFRQNGRDAYTNEELSVNFLSEYEVDHIIPQCYLKDDSIDNKVLVKRSSNQKKGGDVPNVDVIRKMRYIWSSWEKAGLISSKKMKHLTMGKISENTKEGFINRQLVENRQITKHVANILVKYFEGEDIRVLTPKAGLTSQFRNGEMTVINHNYDRNKVGSKKFIKKNLHGGFPKNRDINDYHHAHDAYLNCIVALYLYRAYPELSNAWVYGEYVRNGEKVLGKYVNQRKEKANLLLASMLDEKWNQIDPITGEIMEFDRDEVMDNIEKTLGYRNVNVVKKVERQKGKFGDESVYKQDKKAKNFAAGIKSNLDPNEYGGTKSPISAFIVVIRNKKGDIKPLSITTMNAAKYINAHDKLKMLNEMYPQENIIEIVIDEVDKYTRFDNEFEGRTISRIVASAKEAQKAGSLSLTVKEMRALNDGDEAILYDIYDKITNYLESNFVYNEKHINNWKNKVFEYFDSLELSKKIQFIKDAFSITKAGTTNARGDIKGRIGADSGRQRYTNKQHDILHKDTTLIYQSITGLYESRRKLS